LINRAAGQKKPQGKQKELLLFFLLLLLLDIRLRPYARELRELGLMMRWIWGGNVGSHY
jgi:hypothetical protein